MTTTQAASRSAGGRRWFGRHSDLSVFPFPSVSGKDLLSRLRAVDELRGWAEARAEEAVDWYQHDKRIKRAASRALRAVGIVLAVAGATAPLASAAWQDDVGGWGYVLLAGATGCAAFDHFFGVSAGWMRDMATMQSLKRRLEQFRLEWTSGLLLPTPSVPGEDGPAVLSGPAGEKELVRRLGLVRDFVEDVTRMVEAETSEWMREFRANVGQLYSQVGLPYHEV